MARQYYLPALGPPSVANKAIVRSVLTADLSDVGASNRGADFFASYVSNPAQYGNTVMPPFAGLGEENLAKLGAFLDASKGPKG